MSLYKCFEMGLCWWIEKEDHWMRKIVQEESILQDYIIKSKSNEILIFLIFCFYNLYALYLTVSGMRKNSLRAACRGRAGKSTQMFRQRDFCAQNVPKFYARNRQNYLNSWNIFVLKLCVPVKFINK